MHAKRTYETRWVASGTWVLRLVFLGVVVVLAHERVPRAVAAVPSAWLLPGDRWPWMIPGRRPRSSRDARQNVSEKLPNFVKTFANVSKM